MPEYKSTPENQPHIIFAPGLALEPGPHPEGLAGEPVNGTERTPTAIAKRDEIEADRARREAERQQLITRPFDPRNNLVLSQGTSAKDWRAQPFAVTWEQFVGRMTTPEVGPKEGPWFSCGPYVDGRRAAANFTGHDLWAFDGDKSIDPSDPEGKRLLETCVDPQLAHKALKAAGLTHVIATTHSHGSPEKGNRFRVFGIPSRRITSKLELQAIEACVREILNRAGLLVAQSSESTDPARLWYPSRVNSNRQDLFWSARHDGEALDVDAAVAWHQSTQPARAAPRSGSPGAAPVTGATGEPGADTSIFSWFTAALPKTKDLMELVTRHGYEVRVQEEYEGEPDYRLLSPYSTTGEPGVRVIKPKDLPHAALYCFNASDPVFGEFSEHGCTISSALALLDFAGNWGAAARWLEQLRVDVGCEQEEQRILAGCGEHAQAFLAMAAMDEGPGMDVAIADLQRASKRTFTKTTIKAALEQLRPLVRRQKFTRREPGSWFPALDSNQDGTLRAADLELMLAQIEEDRRLARERAQERALEEERAWLQKGREEALRSFERIRPAEPVNDFETRRVTIY